ncbi:MAG: inositol monophosphatase family protein [Akkermansiaceae bacterium]
MNISSEVLTSCVALVKSVGVFQMKYFRAMPEGADSVKAVREIVSFVDVESEKMLYDGLLPLVENAGFFGEESGKSGSQELVWIVDPLDGTTNYLSGMEQFSISVALVHHDQPILGIVYKPYADDMYTCIRGQGVCFNGAAVKPSLLTEPVDALFMTGFPYRSPDLVESFLAAVPKVMVLGRGIRRFGSAAIDIASLAMGWVQGFWETELQPYDVAAALLMAEENGIIVTNEQGEPYDMFSDRILVAGMPKVHKELLAIIQAAYSV